jgi:hypothetical protein
VSEVKKHTSPGPSGEEPPEASPDEAHRVWEDEGGSLVNAPSTQDDHGSSGPQPISVATDLPSEKADRFTEPLGRFLKIEAAAGAALLVATCAALLLSNSAWSTAFLSIWEIPVGFRFGSFDFSRTLQHWLNDGLMTLFFFVVALELGIGNMNALRDPSRKFT